MVVYIPLSKTGKYAGKYEAIVDDIDADLADFNWNIFACKYAQRRPDKYTPLISMHRAIMERVLARQLLKGEEVDHINGNGLDNRRENLRIATSHQNKGNLKRQKNNTSGYKGVGWDKSRQRWVAKITYLGKTINLGRFETPESAHAAYCQKAKELFGEFARFE